MTTYNICSHFLPLDPQAYHLHVVQKNSLELVWLNERYEKKHEKYSKTLDRLTWLNACSTGLSTTSGILSVATLSTLIGLPVSIPLGAISLAGASIGGIATAPTKKYQKKLAKVTKLTDIVTLAFAMFETSVSKMLKDGKIDEWEFNMLQPLYNESFNNLSKVDLRWKQKKETNSKKPMGKNQQPEKGIEKELRRNSQ